jgi:tetratricopeptide (TPR) repeat protein
MPAQQSGRLIRRTTIASILVLGAAIWLVYGRSLHAPFIFDDELTIETNPSIVRLWPPIGSSQERGPLNPPKELPTSGRPLVNLSVAVNYYFGGENPVGYRVLNIVLHWLSAVVLLGIVRITLRLPFFDGRFDDSTADLLALTTALWWAVHPLQTETVVYITQRTELMVGFFYLATLYASLRYWTAELPAARKRWLVIAGLACMAGMACKEVMVSAPLVVLLFEWTFIAGSFRNAMKTSWRLYLALALGWILLFALNYPSPRGATAGLHLGIWPIAYWLTQTKVLLMYLKLVVWPWPLAIHYSFPYLNNLGEAWPWLAPAVILGVVMVVLAWWRNSIGFVGVATVLILSPTMIVPIITEVAAERRMYLPLAAITPVMVVGIYGLLVRARRALGATRVVRASSSGRRKEMAVVGVVVAIVLGIVSIRRLAAYDSVLILWQDAAAVQPSDPVVLNNVGMALLRTDRYEDARQQFERVLELSPHWLVAQRNFADTFAAAGQFSEAAEHFQEVLKEHPDDAQSWNSLGRSLLRIGRYEEAVAAFQRAIRCNPDYGDAYNNLGNELSRERRYAEALPIYEEAIRSNPGLANAHYNLGLVMAILGRGPEAIEQWQITLRLSPNFAEAHSNLGTALNNLGRPEEAVTHYQQAIKLRPQLYSAQENLAATLAKLGRSEEAIAVAERAIDFETAQNELERAERMKAWLANYRAGLNGQKVPGEK